MAIDPVGLGDRFETVTSDADGLRPAEKQNSPLAQRKVEQRKNLLLDLGAQVDEQVAAADEIQP